MLFKLLLTVLLFAGLLSAQENNGDKISKSELEYYLSDTTLIEIFSDISKEYDTFLDIAPLPIFDELTDLDNENVNQVFESISKFNDLVNNDQKMLGSVEQPVKSSKDYDTCETFMNWTECTFFRDKGNYSIIVKQYINPTSYQTYSVYCSRVFEGVDSLPGVFESLDYDSMYLLQEQWIGFEGKGFTWHFYRPVFLPEFSNQLWHTHDILVIDDESTIYTPWGTSSNREMVFIDTDYAWDYTLNENIPTCVNKMTLSGNVLTMSISAWSYNKEGLFIFWLATWDFESHTGTWISLDENGIVQNTGPM